LPKKKKKEGLKRGTGIVGGKEAVDDGAVGRGKKGKRRDNRKGEEKKRGLLSCGRSPRQERKKMRQWTKKGKEKEGGISRTAKRGG